MLLTNYYLDTPPYASYLIQDEATRTAAVVDPHLDIHRYLRDASSSGCQIQYIFLTHIYPQGTTGHLALRDQTGAMLCLGAKAQVEFPFKPLSHHDVLEFGAVRIQIRERPEHAPESITLCVYHLERDQHHPAVILTGDVFRVPYFPNGSKHPETCREQARNVGRYRELNVSS